MPRQPELEEMLSQIPLEDDLGVQDYLDGFAKALTAGNGKAIARMWATPSFVLGEAMAIVVENPAQVEQFFGGAREQYNARGVANTRADIVRLDHISDRLVMVRVRWPWLDAQNREVGGETSTYTLQLDEDGEWKLRVAVMHGAEAVN
jgi:hypothetical protein